MTFELFTVIYNSVFVLHLALILWVSVRIHEKPDQPALFYQYSRIGVLLAAFLPILFVLLAIFNASEPYRIRRGLNSEYAQLLILIVGVQHILLIGFFIASNFINNGYRSDRFTRWQWRLLVGQILAFGSSLAAACTTIVLIFSGRPRDNLLPLFAWLLGVALGFGLRQSHMRGQQALPVVMDDNPLHEEIRNIASYFGFEDVQVRVVPLRSRREDEKPDRLEKFIRWQSWYPRFHLARPTIPLNLLQSMNTNCLTAALACAYAKRGRLPKELHFLRKLSRRNTLFRLMLITLLSLAFSLIILTILMSVPHALPGGDLSQFIMTILAVLGILVLPRLILRRNHLIHGFEAWRCATPDERTPEAFLAAVLEFDYLFLNLDKMDTLIASYRSLRSVRRFVRKTMGRDVNEVVDEIARSISTSH